MSLTSKDKDELRRVWVQAVAKEPADDVLKRIVRVLNQLKEVEVKAVVYSCVPLKILLLPHAKLLRQQLPPDERIELYFRRSSEAKDLVRETASIALEASQKRLKRFWQDAAKYVEYEGFLWYLAPDDVKHSIHQEHEELPHAKQGTKPQIKWIEPVATVDWEEQLKTKSAEKVLEQALEAFRKTQNLHNFVGRLPEVLLVLSNACRLRQALPQGKRVSLYSKYIKRKDCPNFWISELPMFLKSLNFTAEKQFWREIVDDVPSESKALEFAPENVKKQILKQGFEHYFEALESIRPQNLKPSVTFGAKSVYSSLTDEDKALAEKWTNADQMQADPYELAKMLSARSAEKVVGHFYKRLDHEVKDTAITQLAKNRTINDWLTHDLLLDDKTPVDVKNARSPVSKGTYIEHTVPKFKKNRQLRDVVIAGVRSPYLKLEYIQSPKSIPDNFRDVRREVT